jgi:L-asparaginase II
MSSATPLVRVLRSGLEESVHLGHVAVCDATGRLEAFAGDPHHPVFARSSMKPLQAAVSLAAIGDALPLDQVAMMCASHNGQPVHVRTVRALLRAFGLSSTALRNPPGWPLDPDAARNQRRPTRLTHNCSGKHAGMLAASECSGWDLETYLNPHHPFQQRVLRAVLRATGRSEVVIGVDGCGVPVHGMPLSAMATLYARLVGAASLGRLAAPTTTCVEAMRRHPYLVGGRNRTDTAVMQAAPGLVVKSGAEALACAGIPEAGLGVAVKVGDGGERASGPALIHALASMGGLSQDQLDSLHPFARRVVKGGGVPVGEVVADFRLRPGDGRHRSP